MRFRNDDWWRERSEVRRQSDTWMRPASGRRKARQSARRWLAAACCVAGVLLLTSALKTGGAFDVSTRTAAPATPQAAQQHAESTRT
jgi:hypothetical protein